jgi:HEAT repeat protein
LFPEKAKQLWLRALERPEADYRCKAAEAIGLARRRGFKGMETTVPALVAALGRPDQHPTVRLAIAKALVTLDAKEAAPDLLAQAKDGSNDLHEVVAPALARWQYRPAGDLWLARLRDPATPRRSLLRAIRGLAALREGQAADRLRELVFSDQASGPTRLEAARALGEVRTAGLEKDAERLAADPSPHGLVGRLAAAALLHRHQGKEAVGLLQRLGKDTEPAVAAAAAGRLVELDPPLALPLLGFLRTNPDPSVRLLAVEVLFRLPTEEHIRLLGDGLDDEHPDVRGTARADLEKLAAKKGLRDRVIAQGTRVLAGDGWRGLEQATILLTRLDHKPAVGRLVGLLEHNRPEVFVTAAWGLRRLAVKATLPAALAYVQGELERLGAGGLPKRETRGPEWIDFQDSQLNQFLGEHRYRPADRTLRRFIPKPGMTPIGPESRAAAIWALGRIHEGKTVGDLVAPLEARLNDSRSIPPEDLRVRRMSAITLGRLKAKAALASLRANYPHGKPSPYAVNNASGWAIAQITGVAMPAPEPIRRVRRDWFLSPHE